MKNYNQDRYLISENGTVEEALSKIEMNTLGFICTTNKKGEVVGLATDGDIRRGLIRGVGLKAPISQCSNSNFLSATVNASREQLIKQLDKH